MWINNNPLIGQVCFEKTKQLLKNPYSQKRPTHNICNYLDKTNKKLLEISSTMETASRKTRTIERKLKNVEALPISNEDEFYNQDLTDISLLNTTSNE